MVVVYESVVEEMLVADAVVVFVERSVSAWDCCDVARVVKVVCFDGPAQVVKTFWSPVVQVVAYSLVQARSDSDSHLPPWDSSAQWDSLDSLNFLPSTRLEIVPGWLTNKELQFYYIHTVHLPKHVPLPVCIR